MWTGAFVTASAFGVGIQINKNLKYFTQSHESKKEESTTKTFWTCNDKRKKKEGKEGGKQGMESRHPRKEKIKEDGIQEN